MTKSEYDLLKNALNKNYKIVYEIEKDIERHVTGRLLSYNGGNVVLLNEDKNELYHIPSSGLKWLLPVKKSIQRRIKLAKILYKKKVYEYRKDCVDEFGEYNWYFKIYICFSKVGITWQIDTSDMTVNDKKLKHCLDSVLNDLEENNQRYYRLKDKIFSKNLANKLW